MGFQWDDARKARAGEEPHVLHLRATERERLVALVQDPGTFPETRRNARILLECDLDHGVPVASVPAVARQLGVTAERVMRAVRMYRRDGIEGAMRLGGNPAWGAKHKATPDMADLIVTLVRTEPPNGAEHWTAADLAASVKAMLGEPVGVKEVRRILAKEKIHLRQASWGC